MWAQNQRWMADNVSHDHRNGVAQRVWEPVCRVCVYSFRFFVCLGSIAILKYSVSFTHFTSSVVIIVIICCSSFHHCLPLSWQHRNAYTKSKYETNKKTRKKKSVVVWTSARPLPLHKGCCECCTLCRTHDDQIIWYGDFYRFVFSLFLCILTRTISINYT